MPHPHQSEAQIQREIIKFLSIKGWVCMVTHGSEYQQGFPDLYILHPKFEHRWVEVKRPTGYCFTPAQQKFFPIIANSRGKIFIMTAATEAEYDKLFKEPNWPRYMYSCIKP